MSGFKTIVVSDRQTVSDIALQEYGCVAPGLVLLLKDNEGVITSVHTVPAAGTVLRVRVPVPELTSTNRQVVAAYAAENRTVVSNNQALPDEPVTDMYVLNGYVDNGYINNLLGNRINLNANWQQHIVANSVQINPVFQNLNLQND